MVPMRDGVKLRTLVQVQSAWFPRYDRNPQTFVPNILYTAPAPNDPLRSATDCPSEPNDPQPSGQGVHRSTCPMSNGKTDPSTANNPTPRDIHPKVGAHVRYEVLAEACQRRRPPVEAHPGKSNAPAAISRTSEMFRGVFK